MICVFNFHKIVYGAQEPLNLLCAEIITIQRSVNNSTIVFAAEIDKTLTKSKEEVLSHEVQFAYREWYDVNHGPHFQEIRNSSYDFFTDITSQLQPLIDGYKTSNEQNRKSIAQLKEYLEKEEELYAVILQNHLKFVELTTGHVLANRYTEFQQKVTQLITQFYSEQKEIKERGRLKVLEILQLLADSVVKTESDVDDLTQTMDGVSMGATGGTTTSLFSIPEGETSQEHQEDKEIE